MSSDTPRPDRPDGVDPMVGLSLQAALESARDRLLDRSLRNKLINTPLGSARARQVRVFGEQADAVFDMLRAGKSMTFIAGKGDAAPQDEEGDLFADEDRSLAEARHRDTRLQTRLTEDGLQKRLLSLFYEGQTLEDEQGVNVLFLALGFLEWRDPREADTARYAPLILLPVDLIRDGARDRFKLKIRPEDLIANVSLQAWLKDQFGVALPDLPDTEDWTPSTYGEAVRQAVAAHPGWSVRMDEILLGFFSFAKFLLWRDLDPANWPAASMLTEHPLLREILLREDDAPLTDIPVIADEERVDQVFPPGELIHVTDADSSQAIAIQEVMSGKNLVIQGPPGTGKSQTITNIIAGAVKRGKSVLFIAEKMAALDVVHQRLVDRKLATICLELHSRKSSKTQVLEQIRRARDAAAPPAWPPAVLDDLQETQQILRAHADKLHAAGRQAFSPFELIGRISLLRAQGAPVPNFKLPEAADWTRVEAEAALRRAAQLAGRLAAMGVPAAHPWRGFGRPSPDMLELERIRPLAGAIREAAQALSAAFRETAGFLGATASASLGDLPRWVAALRHIGDRPKDLDPVLFAPALAAQSDAAIDFATKGGRLAAIRSALDATVRPETLDEDWAPIRRVIAGEGRSLFRMFSTRYRQAVADLRGSWIGDLPKAQSARLEALDQLVEARLLSKTLEEMRGPLAPVLGPLLTGDRTDWATAEAAARWVSEAKAYPQDFNLLAGPRNAEQATRLANDLDARFASLDSALRTLETHVALDETVAFDGRSRSQIGIDESLAIADRWVDGLALLPDWPTVRDDLAWLRDIRCAALADDLFHGRAPADHVESIMALAIYEAGWARVLAETPDFARVAGDELDTLVRRFRRADLDRIRIAADEVLRAHIDRRPTGSSGAVGVLIQELSKARRLKPVRRLMEEAGEAIQRFTPVFLMSPLSVAQYLQPGRLEFDLLVIDEASQVRPEDALGAIARCRQIVVVGDDRQLPPTNFFNRMINDEDGEDEEDADEALIPRAAVRDIESILNLCFRFPERMLRWHYRSEHPALIATSNRNFYKNQLMLPPSVVARATDGHTGLIFHKVAEGGYERGKTARNEIEAEAVAQAALRHALDNPHLSLGVGTFSVAQRDAVRDRIDDLARKHPELEAVMKGGDGVEPLFVKNLENIQGDERDVIFISVGYGRDKDGRLTQNFGPVGRDGGDRRLNVLITRARKRCEVFSSLVAEDIRLDANPKLGVVALKEFLQLARDGYSDLISPTDRDFDSDFEEAVAHAVRGLGYECRPQVGMAGFFIDLAIIDPRDPDRYVLGVECDGAAYHSSRYARDRDRLRQQILESRGWRIHRIWSTDWFYRQEREIERLKAAIEAAVEGRAAPAEEPSNAPLPAADPEITSPLATSAVDQAVLKPYVVSTVRSVGKTRLTGLADHQVAEFLERIVDMEQPIHDELLTVRFAEALGLQQSPWGLDKQVRRGLKVSLRTGVLQADGPFVSRKGQALEPRNRGEFETADPVKKAALISPLELAAAARIALDRNLALSRKDLITETARLLGYPRTGKNIAAAIEAAIDNHLQAATETDHLGRIRLVD